MILLSTMMLPFWVTIIPRFLLYREIGWISTWLPLIVPSYFANPIYVFLMRQFFMTLRLNWTTPPKSTAVMNWASSGASCCR